jgi:deoxyguanosine kinase
MKQIITVIGNVAAGKSSAMSIITRAVKGYAIDADDLFQTSDPFRIQFLEDTPRWAFANELWLTLERAQLLRRELAQCAHSCVVVDSGLLMSWVYTHSHFLVGKLSLPEWELYKELYEELTQDLFKDLKVVYLDYSLETLMYRLQLRGRDYELQYYTWDYLEQLQAGLLMLIKDLQAKKTEIIHVTEAAVPDFVKNDGDSRGLREIIKDQLLRTA